MSNAIFQGLNDEQVRAVQAIDGPLLILAGAGSGKTKTLTHRIAYLLTEQKAEPHNILAVTFTNKAATEMRQRIWQLLYGAGNQPDEIPRHFMPYMGTFHGVCVRLLRSDGQHIGIPSSFVIFDESDRQAAIKRASKQLHIDEKAFPPRQISNLISSAKNELLMPDAFIGAGSGPLHEAAAQVYPLYQQMLKDAQALDFDDLIMRTVRLFEAHAEIKRKWQQQFRYVMIDEYQDTNNAQYRLVKLLVGPAQNIAVVGDDWQCFPAEAMVATRQGNKQIKSIKKNDEVLAASGYGDTGFFPVKRLRKHHYKGELVHITTESGKQLSATPKHTFFSRWGATKNYFVYLMYERSRGYRIGMVKGSCNDSKKDDASLRIRANQKGADAMWIIKACPNRKTAAYHEALYSSKYGIPKTVFHTYPNRSMQLSEQELNSIFDQIDTTTRAAKLFSDEGLLRDTPHFRSSDVIAHDHKRVVVNLVLFADKRKTLRSPWSASRISVNATRKADLDVFQNLGYHVRPGKRGTYRVEIHNLNYGLLEEIIASIQQDSPSVIVYRYAFIGNKKLFFTPATHLHEDMFLPVIADDGTITEERITAIERQQHDGDVYDLDIGSVHNYAVDSVISHNSIYSWRGADFKNILNFERDYSNVTIIKLEQNYRSTKAILDAAHKVIAKNRQRSDKQLWTDVGAGAPVKVVQSSNERSEAEAIINRITSATDLKARSFRDFAVLYRTNAQSRSLEDMFIRYGVPYRIVGGVRFYDRKEIKDLVAYLRVIFQPEDRVSFERIINTPTRGIGAKSMQTFFSLVQVAGTTQAAFDSLDQAKGLSSRAINSLMQLRDVLVSLRQRSDEVSVSFLLESLVSETDYLEYLDDGSLQGESRQENVKELIGVAKAYDELGLETFLEEVSLISDLDGADLSSDVVTLMTLHAAKGLEFPVVFMAGMEESIFPHSRSLYDQSEMEEERRLCYVGMTRAKEELVFLHATSRMLYGGMQHNPPSRFLSDFDEARLESASSFGMSISSFHPTGFSPKQLAQPSQESQEPAYVPDLSEGDGVKHGVFGHGTVVEIDGDIATVYFKQRGPKKLNITIAPIEKIEG